MRGALVMAVILTATAVCADERAQGRLAESRAKWESHRITSYSFVLWMNGAWMQATPVQIVVKNGEVKSARYMHYDRPAEASWEARESWTLRDGREAEPTWRLTIPALFERAKSELERPRTETLLKFHPQLGYPTEIAYRQPHITDSNAALWVNNFKILR
jgi:hypothetical protein